MRETSRLLAEAEASEAAPTRAAALSALIRAAVARQLRRPALARLLDFEEARLPFDPDTRQVGDRFRAILSDLPSRPDLPRQPGPAAAARDVVAMAKGMVDAAGTHGETDQRALASRVGRAVFGYLGAPA